MMQTGEVVVDLRMADGTVRSTSIWVVSEDLPDDADLDEAVAMAVEWLPDDWKPEPVQATCIMGRHYLHRWYLSRPNNNGGCAHN